METWALSLLAFFILTASAQDSWIGIDCGSNTRTTTNGALWQTDEPFIKTGTNHLIPQEKIQPLAILNTLRVFAQQNKNCYTLPAQTMARYFLRAVFFYGNYDGLSSPPTFDLQIDGNEWTTVVSSSTEVRYFEILYRSRGNSVSVCLARTRNDQFPFISSLEAWTIPDTVYTWMSQDLAWLSNYRYNYGSDNWIVGYLGDKYNRVWEPMSVPGSINTTAYPGTTIFATVIEHPPDSAILDAIESQSETTSIFLSFSSTKNITPIYIEAYFTETQLTSIGARSFDMYVNGTWLLNVIPRYQTVAAGMVLVQALDSNLTIELRPTRNTLLPPSISAIEIYTASDALVTSGTDQDDVNGLEALTGAFDQLKGWSGEPCLPTDTVWQWLSCRGTNPPRVTTIHLSGYGLNGNLPHFSQMQALEDIDLSNNSLSGQIPGFLGNLPYLKRLNLSSNGFSGTLPSSIRNNKGLTYDINGNPNLDASGKDKSSKATVIGLAVGIPLVVIVPIVAFVVWLMRKRAIQGQNQEAELETGNGTESNIKPDNQPMVPEMDTDELEELIDQHENGESSAKPYNQSMVPEIDLDELEELIDQHKNAGGHEIDIAEPTSDDDYVAVGEFGADASNDLSMVPDMDLEELDEIIRDQKERSHELTGQKTNT